MPAKWHKYSYSAQRAERQTIFSIVSLIILLSVVFALIHIYLVTMYNIESSTMEPSLSSGDCVISTPLYRYKKDNSRGVSPLIAPRRGDLVVIAPAYQNETNPLLKAVNSLVAFLTFQRLRPFDHKDSWGEKPVIRRLVAFPGDSVFMENFVLQVKTGDSTHFLTEFELSEQMYDIKLDNLPASWSVDLPFSGSFPVTTLGEGEFFVLCDNRISSSDSRTWGPVPSQRIRGKVVLRYWPFSHFGPL